MKRTHLLLALLALVGVDALAGSPIPVKMKCPVGGERFTYITTASLSQWGSRPDGKPYGSWTFPSPLAECPGNGLVMYRPFTKEEVKALKPILASSEFKSLRGTETPYYRAFWLMGKLGDPALQRVWVLQQAAWESDEQPDRKRRYLEEFVQLAAQLPAPAPPKAEDLEWVVSQLRAANAWRELARFDEAEKLLASVPLDFLNVPVPEERVSGKTPSGYGKIVENYAEIRAAEGLRSWMRYAEKLRKVIARHDAASEPIDMVPTRVAAELCFERPASTPEHKAVCESEAVASIVERIQKARAPATPTPASEPAKSP